MLSEHKLEVLRTVEASELPVREVLGFRTHHHGIKGTANPEHDE